MKKYEHLVSNEEFISEIIDDALGGKCFVPFIGSGLSSPSGIITGQEFTKYLAYVFYLMVRHSTATSDVKSVQWSLQKQGWPSYPSDGEIESAINWIRSEFDVVCRRYGWELTYERDSSLSGRDVKKLTIAESVSGDFYHSMAKPPTPLILRGKTFRDEPDRFKKLLESLHRHGTTHHDIETADFEDYMLDRGMSYHEQIVEKGIRSLADWKATLTFLSRIRVIEGSTSRILLETPDTSVIDAFNKFITGGRKPSFGHKILAQLSKPLRFRKILTTNFDNLTETAFEEIGIHLTVLPVTKHGGLQRVDSVNHTDTLVKLHGDSHDTRADLSLDEEPTDYDKKTFAAYLTRSDFPFSRNFRKGPKEWKLRSDRLLVIGYSGSDHRCVQMIKHWLETGEDDPRVYWICFNDYDADKVDSLFKSSGFAGRVITTKTPRPELLLFELYQRIELTLPPGGSTYEFLHAAPPSQENDSEEEYRSMAALKREINNDQKINIVWKLGKKATRKLSIAIARDAIESLVIKEKWEPDSVAKRFVTVTPWSSNYREYSDSGLERTQIRTPWIVHSAIAVEQAAAIAYQDLSRNHNKKVFWFELEGQLDADALLRELLRMLAVRFGDFMVNHVTMHPEGLGRLSDLFKNNKGNTDTSDQPKKIEEKVKRLRQHFDMLLRTYHVDSDSIVVFLYGVDSYGHCAGIDPDPSKWEEEKFRALHLVIEALAATGIAVIYFPLTKWQKERNETICEEVQRKIKRCLPSLGEKAVDLENVPDPFLFKEPNSDGSHLEQQMVRDITNLGGDCSLFQESLLSLFMRGSFLRLIPGGSTPELDTNQQKAIEFLYALTLFRISRHPSSLMVEGVFPCPFRYNRLGIDNDFFRLTQTSNLINELIDLNVFHQKPGGLLWFNGEVRKTLRSTLENLEFEVKAENKEKSVIKLVSRRSRSHFWIADWYMKAFMSSGHIAPFIESTYHLNSSAYFAKYARFRSYDENSNHGDKLSVYQLRQFQTAMGQASRNLKIAWNHVEFWQASSVEVSWLDEREAIRRKLYGVLDVICPQKNNNRLVKQEKNFAKNLLADFSENLDQIASAVLLAGKSGDRELKYAENYHQWPTKSAQKFNTHKKTPDKEPLVVKHDWKKIGSDEESFEGYIKGLFSCCNPELSVIRESIDGYCKGNYESIRLGETKSTVRDKMETFDDYQKCIWLLTEVAYLYLRRGKASYHAIGMINTEIWLKATLYCNLALDFCRQVSPNSFNFEMMYKTKLQGIYGVSLANLGRFQEANRHLIDAQSICNASPSTTPLDLAIIKIRMAELALTKCFWLKNIVRSEIFKFDDKLQRYENSESFVDLPSKFLVVDFSKDCKKFPEVPRNCLSLTKFVINRSPANRSDANLFGIQGGLKLIEDDGYGKLYSEQAVLRDVVFLPSIFEEVFHKTTPHGMLTRSASDINSDGQLQVWHKSLLRDLNIQLITFLDEAVVLLDSSEALLQGATHNSHWWFQLRLMQLRVYGYLGFVEIFHPQCLIFRHVGPRDGIKKAFTDAWRIAGNDRFRLLRSFRYLIEAEKWHRGVAGGDSVVDFDAYWNLLKGLQDSDGDSSGFLYEMHKRVMGMYEDFKGQSPR
ncbi:MAG: SIR2 family protein [Pirellula sp.]|jgi:hypothetical protein|nr:SIR2 family protein [Pirellula sp.]